ncbi:MAG TPA: hypothetical protein DD727_07645 [Clostridiales bacterium]|nr:hypothetical protein [Clostridiales bacterium]
MLNYSASGNAAMGGILAVLAGFAAVVVIIIALVGIAMYVLLAAGLMKMAENRNIPNAWLAWIPVANMYILGLLVREISLFGQKIPSLELILPAGTLFIGLLSRIPFLGGLIGLAWLIFNIAVLYNLYRQYKPESAALYTVLSVVLPFLAPVLVFSLRNQTPVS